jgi:tol-pal system protein YbgF
MKRLLLAAFLWLGTTSGTALGQSRELIQLQADVVALSSQVSQIQRTLDERNAVFLQLIEQVVDEVVGLAGTLERVTGTSADVRMSNETLSGEMRVLMSSLRGDLELMDRNIRELGIRMDAISNQITGMNTTSSGLGAPSARFAQAEGDFYARNYELARQGFREFISQNPNSPQAADAQLYIANSFYDSADYEQAVIEYDLLLQTYSNSDKRSEALYKKGLAYANLSQPQTAMIYFHQVVADYPGSREASMAQDRILEAGAGRSEPR